MSLSTVNRAHMAYDHGGLKALRRKPSGGRKRENMTLAEEKVLLTGFAKAAGAGELLNTDQQEHGLQSSCPAWLAQADAASIPSQTRHRGSKRFKKKRFSQCCEESSAGCRQAWPSLAIYTRGGHGIVK
jgi:hypothetical protein